MLKRQVQTFQHDGDGVRHGEQDLAAEDVIEVLYELRQFPVVGLEVSDVGTVDVALRLELFDEENGGKFQRFAYTSEAVFNYQIQVHHQRNRNQGVILVDIPIYVVLVNFKSSNLCPNATVPSCPREEDKMKNEQLQIDSSTPSVLRGFAADLEISKKLPPCLRTNQRGGLNRNSLNRKRYSSNDFNEHVHARDGCVALSNHLR